jgi:2-oxoglutarate ferredoxin oxidoreductase subunit alpha
MQLLRAEKVARIADDIPDLQVYGPEEGELLIVGWGSTYGAIRSAVDRLNTSGRRIAHAHVRHLNPLPRNTGEVLARYPHVLVPEVNLGQLLLLLRGRFLVDAIGYNRVRGKPFRISEIEAEVERVLGQGVRA